MGLNAKVFRKYFVVTQTIVLGTWFSAETFGWFVYGWTPHVSTYLGMAALMLAVQIVVMLTIEKIEKYLEE
ncbi:MAG: hypothetical protein KDI38_03560 [Calditrichaeota bacterium]|nr:hypothetical protein [Calditrichota bacterium]